MSEEERCKCGNALTKVNKGAGEPVEYTYCKACDNEIAELKARQCPATFGDYKCHVDTNVKDSKGRTVSVDKCLKDIVEYLNKGGLRTVASCGGHNQVQPIISIELDQIAMERYFRKRVESITDEEIEEMFTEEVARHPFGSISSIPSYGKQKNHAAIEGAKAFKQQLLK